MYRFITFVTVLVDTPSPRDTSSFVRPSDFINKILALVITRAFDSPRFMIPLSFWASLFFTLIVNLSLVFMACVLPLTQASIVLVEVDRDCFLERRREQSRTYLGYNVLVVNLDEVDGNRTFSVLTEVGGKKKPHHVRVRRKFKHFDHSTGENHFLWIVSVKDEGVFLEHRAVSPRPRRKDKRSVRRMPLIAAQ